LRDTIRDFRAKPCCSTIPVTLTAELEEMRDAGDILKLLRTQQLITAQKFLFERQIPFVGLQLTVTISGAESPSNAVPHAAITST
jgi:hypothetical protein